MAWIYRALAGLCEIGQPIGLKPAWTDAGARPRWIGFAVVAMAVSGALLLLAQRDLPIDAAYAVWTGIGAVGTFAVGIAVFGDAASTARIASASLNLAGLVGLNLAGAGDRSTGLSARSGTS